MVSTMADLRLAPVSGNGSLFNSLRVIFSHYPGRETIGGTAHRVIHEMRISVSIRQLIRHDRPGMASPGMAVPAGYACPQGCDVLASLLFWWLAEFDLLQPVAAEPAPAACTKSMRAAASILVRAFFHCRRRSICRPRRHLPSGSANPLYRSGSIETPGRLLIHVRHSFSTPGES